MNSSSPQVEQQTGTVPVRKSRPLWPWVAGTLFLTAAAVVFSFWWPMYRSNRVLKQLRAQSLSPVLITEYEIEYHHPRWAGLILDEETFHPWFDELFCINALAAPVSGKLLDELRQFRDLRELNIAIENAPLEKLRQFESLETLGLFGGHALDWDRPVRRLEREEWEQLATQLHVKSLSFGHFGLSGCKVPNPDIEELTLVMCEIDGTFGEAIAGLQGLQSLSLYDSTAELAFWENISVHPALTKLELESSPVKGESWDQLCRIQSLKTLVLAFASSDPFDTSEPPSLPTKSEFDDSEWEQLSRLKNLEELSLRDMMITEKTMQVIAALPRLRTLGLENVSVDAVVIEELGSSSSLESVDIYQSDLNKIELKTFTKQHPHLRVNHDYTRDERARELIK